VEQQVETQTLGPNIPMSAIDAKDALAPKDSVDKAIAGVYQTAIDMGG